MNSTAVDTFEDKIQEAFEAVVSDLMAITTGDDKLTRATELVAPVFEHLRRAFIRMATTATGTSISNSNVLTFNLDRKMDFQTVLLFGRKLDKAKARLCEIILSSTHGHARVVAKIKKHLNKLEKELMSLTSTTADYYSKKMSGNGGFNSLVKITTNKKGEETVTMPIDKFEETVNKLLSAQEPPRLWCTRPSLFKRQKTVPVDNGKDPMMTMLSDLYTSLFGDDNNNNDKDKEKLM